jgi:hypothetical protein
VIAGLLLAGLGLSFAALFTFSRARRDRTLLFRAWLSLLAAFCCYVAEGMVAGKPWLTAVEAILAAVVAWAAWLNRHNRRRRRAARAMGAKSRARVAALVSAMRERARPRQALRPVPQGGAR